VCAAITSDVIDGGNSIADFAGRHEHKGGKIMQLSNLLRTILKLDAASCLGMAAVLVPGGAMLEPLLGVPAALLTGAGLSLVPIGLFILWLGMRGEAPAALVYLVILGNVGWSLASFGAAAFIPMISALGVAAVSAQAIAVAAFAMLEYAAVRAAPSTATR
jgi:hypothetical protein